MKRANFKFSDGTAAVLKELTDELGTGQVDVVRMGLRLVRRAVREAKCGNRLAIIGGNGSVVELDGEWSEASRESNP